MKHETILLSHGSGGRLSQELIASLFLKYFGSVAPAFPADSGIVELKEGLLAYTTDSYVVDPLFFKGGNIGKLAVCGTVNDLAVSGAKPLFLSCGFIIEEGFPTDRLEEIVETMAREASLAGVRIVAGDTKVVDRGKCDKLFINTSGIGTLDPERRHISYATHIQPGDKIIINGGIGAHGVAILAARHEIELQGSHGSDCAPLNGIIADMLRVKDAVRFMRDATRGGLGAVLCELASGTGAGITVKEERIPVAETTAGLCEVFGFDPLFLANEGKVVAVVKADEADTVLAIMKNHPLGSNAAIIGEISDANPGLVMMETLAGGTRLIDMPAGEQLPRIC